MKALFWFLLFVVALLSGYLVFNFTSQRNRQSRPVAFEVGPESIQAYLVRIGALEETAARIHNRLQQVAPGERARLSRQLQLLDAQLRDLRVAVAQWRAARTSGRSSSDLYRNCLLLYGRASGICAVLAEDTLLAEPQSK